MSLVALPGVGGVATPLQLGLERPLATVALVVVAAGAVSGALALGSWITRDARARGSDAPRWWAAFAVLSGIGLAAYLATVGRRARSTPATVGERLARNWAAVVVVAFVVGATLPPPDPVSQVLWVAPMLVGGAPIAVWLARRPGG